MITAAIVIAGESSSIEAHELLAAIGGATDDPVDLVPLIDAPGAVILHALPDASAHPADAVTLVVFCGHVVRDYAGRLFFSSRADGRPTPLTAVPIDAVRDAIRSSRRRIVVIFDCTFADDDRLAPGGDRLAALEQSFAGVAMGVLVSNARSMGLDGGIARSLADGVATRDADLDRDGVITLDELFAYARRHVEQVGLPPYCIVSGPRARAMAVIRYRDGNLPGDNVPFSADPRVPPAAPPSVAPRPVPRRRYTTGGRPVPSSASPRTPPSPSPPAPPSPSPSLPPPPPSPSPPSPPPSTLPPNGTSGPRPPASHPAPRRRLMRPIAVVGTAALGVAAVLGAFVSTGGKSSRSAPPTFAAALTTSTSFAATGRARLSAECTRGPDRFAVAVATPPSAVRPLVSAILSIDGGPDARIALVRTAGDVTAPPGVSLYAAALAPFARAGTMRWNVQLSAAADVRSVAIQCGRVVQVLSH